MTETNESSIVLSIDLKKYRLRIHKPTLRLLGSPPYVKLLFSPKQHAIAVMSCEEQLPNGQEIVVTFDKPDSAGTFDIYSKELITRIRNEFGGLDQTGLYRLKGYPMPEEGCVCFPLSTMSRAEENHV